MAEQSVTLNPSESRVVSFEAIPSVAKTYLVSVNGLTGSFIASEAPPPTTRLFGRVTDKITGAPIAGVFGTVYQDYDTKTEKYDFTTDSSGYYLIDNMLFEVDVTMMVIYATGYKTYTNENVPISEGDNQLNVRMSPE